MASARLAETSTGSFVADASTCPRVTTNNCYPRLGTVVPRLRRGALAVKDPRPGKTQTISAAWPSGMRSGSGYRCLMLKVIDVLRTGSQEMKEIDVFIFTRLA
jgi:hypothetical protein